MKRFGVAVFFLCATVMPSSAQFELGEAYKKSDYFNHLDVSFTAGSTGLGFDLAMPVGNYVQVRSGGTFMPHFDYKMKFGIQVGDDPAESAYRFERLSGILGAFSGCKVKDHVDMIGSPTFNNFKLLVDVFPLENKKWHVTAGIYVGGSKIAKSYNTPEAVSSLAAVSMYNNMYWNIYNEEPVFRDEKYGTFEFPPEVNNAFLYYGTMSMVVGYFKEDYYAKGDVLYTHDVYQYDEDGFVEYDNEGNKICLHHAGDPNDPEFRKGDFMYHKGDAYRMYPDIDNMVRANALVNKVRPYIGIGYSTDLTRDKNLSFSVDCGAMMWGGSPKLVTHEGIDMAKDLERINGQVDRYVKIFNRFKCFPVLELRLSHRLF